MNALAIIALYQSVLRALPEPRKREIDKEFKKIENKFKQGSPLDIAAEIGMMVLRGDVIIDYPDDGKEPNVQKPPPT